MNRLVRLTSGHRVMVRRYGRIYRMTIDAETFGQIHRDSDRMWRAEVRHTASGDRLHYAGEWRTLRDAVEELFSLTAEGRAFLQAHRMAWQTPQTPQDAAKPAEA